MNYRGQRFRAALNLSVDENDFLNVGFSSETSARNRSFSRERAKVGTAGMIGSIAEAPSGRLLIDAVSTEDGG